MNAPRTIAYAIRKRGHSWTIYSDAHDAPPGGAIIAGLDAASARKVRDQLRSAGKSVDCPELDAQHVGDSSL